ncbi:MAG: 4-hydroxy-tetrahydrodipicolinate reductase [Chlamydiales bacterium]|nr:4-hydroxy-tetrahydrodipicolinate reductase [Chlamydiales bacterium]
MKIALFGHGKMGTMVEQMAPSRGHLITNLQAADVCIDFSHASVVIDHVKSCTEIGVPIVIGTTGWEEQLEIVQELIFKSESAGLYASNFSLGMAYFIQLLCQARSLFSDFDCTGIEFHHNEKKDAPSGTAKTIAQNLEMQQPFTSVRCGQITGKHTVLFGSEFETISLTHEAHNRQGFAKGSLQAAEWIQHKQGWYTLDEMLRSLYSSSHSIH